MGASSMQFAALAMIMTMMMMMMMMMSSSSSMLVSAQRPVCSMAEFDEQQRADTARLVRRSAVRQSQFGPARLFQGIDFDAQVDVVFHVVYGNDNRGRVDQATVRRQFDLLQPSFDMLDGDSGFTFTLRDIRYVRNNDWFRNCHEKGTSSAMKEALARDVERTMNVITCGPDVNILGFGTSNSETK